MAIDFNTNRNEPAEVLVTREYGLTTAVPLLIRSLASAALSVGGGLPGFSIAFSYEIQFSSERAEIRRNFRDANIFSDGILQSCFSTGDMRNSDILKRKKETVLIEQFCYFISLPPPFLVLADVYKVPSFFYSAGGWGTVWFYVSLDHKTSRLEF